MCSKQNFIHWNKHIDIETIIRCIQRVDYIYCDIISITDLSQGEARTGNRIQKVLDDGNNGANVGILHVLQKHEKIY